VKYFVAILCLAGMCAIAIPLSLAASHYVKIAELIYALTGIGVSGCVVAAIIRRGLVQAWWIGCACSQLRTS